MDIVNKAFLEVLIEGDSSGRGFSYPIPTINLTKNFNWDSENAGLLFKMTGKYGTPYFQNFINSNLNPGDVRSMCCRLQLDKRELRNRGGGLFGSDEFTGSIGVVTLNLPRIGYLSSSKEDYFSQLDHLMCVARDSLEIKRRVITRLMDQGLFPYTQRYLRHWNNHFSTIGLIGMNESTLNFMGKDLTHAEAREFAKEVLIHMREKLVGFQEETGHLYNLEATPGEGTSYRLAKIDRQKFSRMVIPGADSPYYTNSTALPVNTTDDVFEALDMQNDIQRLYTGGTVFHAFIGESIDDAETCKRLVRKIASSYEIPYFTITPTFSVCNNHGYLKGEQFVCPSCGEETEVYSRIVGYYRPVQNWNCGKKSEYRDRKIFKVTEAYGRRARRRAGESCRMRACITGVAGWHKNSFIDFPGTVAAVLFFSGCNLACPYCHNPDIVKAGTSSLVRPDDIADFLEKRKGLIDGVVLSGGEPTLHACLAEAASFIRSLGYRVKLDTNGLLPDAVAAVKPDYLALDVKTAPRSLPAAACIALRRHRTTPCPFGRNRPRHGEPGGSEDHRRARHCRQGNHPRDRGACQRR